MSPLRLLLVAAALAVAVERGAAQAPEAPVWPDQWTAIFAFNETSAAGVATPWEAAAKYYDHTIPALRQDQIVEGAVTKSFIHIGPRLYEFFPATGVCVYVFMGIGPLKQTWLVGAPYIGEFLINDVPSYGWDQAEHYYYASKNSGRPTRLIAFGPSRELLEQNFVNYLEGPIDLRKFEVPEFCLTNSTRTATLKIAPPHFIVDYSVLSRYYS